MTDRLVTPWRATLVVALLVSALAAAVAIAHPTRPRPNPATVAGVYVGTATDTEGVVWNLTLEVQAAKGRRVTAHVVATDDAQAIVAEGDLKGTVAASGNVNLNGRVAAGEANPKLILKLRFTVGEDTLGHLDGRFAFNPRGPRGTVALTRP